MSKSKSGWSRRGLLQSAPALLAGASAFGAFGTFADAAERVRAKISDVQWMELQGPARTYIYVRILTDTGEYGIAEGYGKPNIGLPEQIEYLKPQLIGKDPLEIDRIYTFLGQGARALSGSRTDGSAHNQMRLASCIDMALWDLAGKLLGQPTTVLLGGKFRDRVRLYDHSRPANMMDKGACREWAAQAREHPSGFNAHKMSIPRTAVAFTEPGNRMPDPNHDPSNREVTTRELMMIGQSFENVREAIGWDHDIMVHAHWEFNLESSIQIAKILEPMRPLFFEDPLHVHYSDSWKRLVAESPVPILTGENLVGRTGFQPFFENGAVDIINPDLRNSGGFLETKRIADMASLYGIPMATHNTGSPVHTIQNCQWAGSIRDYLITETSTGDGNWIDSVVLHEDGPYIEDSYIKITELPGTGVRLNREVVEAHLVPGSTWWGGD